MVGVKKDIQYHEIQTRADQIRWMLKMLLDDDVTDWDSLNEWEQSFVERMEVQFDKTVDLSEGQFDKLKEIYDAH